MTKQDGMLNLQLRLADEERDAYQSRLMELKTTALDRTLDLEMQLRAFMQIDSAIWKKRVASIHDCVDGEPDKITASKKNSERRRLARLKAERVALGLPIRRAPIGALHVAEQPDAVRTSFRLCVVCGATIPDGRTLRATMCSKRCSGAAFRARKREKLT